MGKPQVVEYDDDEADRDEDKIMDMLSDLKHSIAEED